MPTITSKTALAGRSLADVFQDEESDKIVCAAVEAWSLGAFSCADLLHLLKTSKLATTVPVAEYILVSEDIGQETERVSTQLLLDKLTLNEVEDHHLKVMSGILTQRVVGQWKNSLIGGTRVDVKELLSEHLREYDNPYIDAKLDQYRVVQEHDPFREATRLRVTVPCNAKLEASVSSEEIANRRLRSSTTRATRTIKRDGSEHVPIEDTRTLSNVEFAIEFAKRVERQR